MFTLGVAGLLAAAAAVHEIALRRGSGAARLSKRWGLVRVAALAFLLVAAAELGSLAELHPRLTGLFAARLPAVPEGLLEPAGDVALCRPPAAARPESPFPESGGAAAVASWRAELRERLRRLFGYPAERPPAPAYRVEKRERAGPVERVWLRYESFDGAWIPAILQRPAAPGDRPAVLVIPGHGLGMTAAAGLVSDYQHGAAFELARAGFVTLTPELRGFGVLGEPRHTEHRLVAYNALLSGTFYKAFLAGDLGRALDLLESLPGVLPGRIGVAGASFGGEMAATIAALDERVRTVAVNAFGGRVGPAPCVTGEAGAPLPRQPHGCHLIPGINRLLAREDWFRLLAPRPLLVALGRAPEPGFAEAVRRAWGELAGRVEIHSAPSGHLFHVDLTVRFLERWLRPEQERP